MSVIYSHFAMAGAENIVNTTFDVTSGALCFGSMHDILKSAAGRSKWHRLPVHVLAEPPRPAKGRDRDKPSPEITSLSRTTRPLQHQRACSECREYTKRFAFTNHQEKTPKRRCCSLNTPHQAMLSSLVSKCAPVLRLPSLLIPRRSPTHDLLNELVLSFLEHFVLPVFHLDRSPSTAGRALFPRRGQTTARGDKEFDTYLYSYFTKPLEKPVVGLDATAVGTRIQDFLSRRAGGDDISVDNFLNCE